MIRHPAAAHELGAGRDRVFDQLDDIVRGRRGDQRADVDAVVSAGADGQAGDRRRKLFSELVVDAVLDQDPVRADAGLAGVAELAQHRALDRLVNVGVVEHDERCVAAQFHRRPLHRSCALLDEQLADLR